MLGILLCAVGLSASAQDAAPQAPTPFRAGVELVRLDVRVTDGDGRSVRDLQQQEVRVAEAGEDRPVVFFQHIEEPTESFAEIASRTVAGEVSTNRGAARGHLYVFVFDQLHIAPGNEQRARLAAERFVRTRLRPGDRVAVHGVPGPGPELAFTADVRRIVNELVKVRGMAEPQAFGALGTMTLQEAFQIVRGDQQVLQRVADRFQSQSAPTDVQRRTDPSSFGTAATPLVQLVREDATRLADIADGETRRMLAMLSDLLRPLRSMEGRKTIVFVSEGFYGDRLPREIDEVAAAAAESYSVVHALDMNRRGPDITADEPTGGDQALAIQDRIAPLGSMAAATGGRLVIDAGQYADRALATLADQAQDYYLIGFTPRAVPDRDRSAYRPVSVRVTRKGAQVSARTGFVLTDAARVDRQHAIERALAAPFSQQGLPVHYTTYVLRGTASGLERVIVSLAAELPIGSRSRAQAADVVFVVRSAHDGRVAASGRDVIPLPEQRAANATTGEGTYHVQFEVPAGDYLMRAVVREPGGLVGSADRRFTVRALDGPALAAGDLVLSSTRGELPVRPMAYIGDGLSGVVELYGRTADQLRDARVVFDLVPIGEHAPAVSGIADPQPPRTTTMGIAREVRVALPLQDVTPGTYVARARVMIGAETVGEVVRDVEVRQGQRPANIDAAREAFDPRQIVNGAVGRAYAERLSANPSQASDDALRGLNRLAAGDYPAAIAAFERSSSDAAAAFFLGWALHGAGDDRQAVSAWRRAAYLDPTLVPAHLALADMYVRLSQPALAAQALRAGLAALPESPELLDRLARIERH